MHSDKLGLDTLAIHAGQEPDPTHAAVMQPIVLASTFAQAEPGKPKLFEYSRSGNPTRQALEACLAAMEGGKHGFAFASGSAATLTLLHTLKPGDHVVSGDDVYGGTFRLFDKVLKPMGVNTSFVDLRDPERLEQALTPQTRLVWMETPTNPMLKLFDIEAIAARCRAHGLPLAVDNTFASPVIQQPLKLGATIVVHSTTKYINGHSDVVGGALITSDEAIAERVGFYQNAIGGVPSPFDCYMVLRGIKTLPVRMRHQAGSAAELAKRLEGRKGVKKVHYPGLESHPDHALAKRQMRLPGAMVSVDLDAGVDQAKRFLSALRIFTLAESLGGVESLAEHPAIMTHASIPKETRDSIGIGDGLVRLSVGLEDVEDLWSDLEGAFAAAGL
ncbi:MAG: PLP-dependent transferase [Myxococcales bacterium]|nr:PLP-dependent transferase [Myxococcales bacterium]